MNNTSRESFYNDEKKDINPVDEIINLIRQELAKRHNGSNSGRNEKENDDPAIYQFNEDIFFRHHRSKVLSFYPIFSLKDNENYHVNDFLIYHQDEFIKNAYIAILGREADSGGLQIFLDRLDNGMSKIEILWRMRYSPEGRKRGLKIRGLIAPLTVQFIYKVPLVSYLCRLVISLLRLPKALRDQMNFNHYLLYKDKNLQTQLNQNFESHDNTLFKISDVIAKQELNLIKVNAYLESLSNKFNDRFDKIENQLNNEINKFNSLFGRLNDEVIAVKDQTGTRINNLNDSVIQFKKNLVLVESRINNLNDSVIQFKKNLVLVESRKAEKEEVLNLAEQKTDRDETYQIKADIKETVRQLHDHKLNILDQHRRMRLFLEEARKRLPGTSQVEQIKEFVKEEDHLLDALYVSFEDRFRGSRENIKTLLEAYLAYLEKCKIRTDNAPILDIGCGRGEWLELCRENGFDASGVDTNNVMISLCSELGLYVTQMDGIQFLKEQESQKYGAITAFHFIEHIEHQERIVFFDETLRVLKSGGVAIFETPNPENLIVGAFNFYMDPTHIKPLVPDTMQFILEQRGFIDVEIKRLHKNKAYYMDKNDNEFKNKWFFNEMDYALIGYKK